jgi:hypothetical protein
MRKSEAIGKLEQVISEAQVILCEYTNPRTELQAEEALERLRELFIKNDNVLSLQDCIHEEKLAAPAQRPIDETRPGATGPSSESKKVDEAVAESFPASDPPSFTAAKAS